MSDNIQTNTTGRLTPCLQQKIDKTRYLVEVHFSDTSTQNNADVPMVNGYGYHLPDRIIKPSKMVQTPTAGVLFLWVCRDSREAAQGVQPLVAAKPPIGARGKFPVRR